MTFYFFDAADTVLFTRNDAEQAEHNHQELSLYALFPYDPDKVITAGMRIGYEDSLGVFQVFEIIKPKTYEPDHYQEITAEHICISELTDEMYTGGDLMSKTAGEALEAILDGTLWQVGTDSTSNESSATFSFGYVWDDVRTIEKNWNVYITPRITTDASGITGRYLDIRPAQATWRGLRFSLEKNMDDAAITWDTSNLKTALYGYGKNSMTVQGQSEKQPWTFGSVTWAAEDGHPAKPSGQIYLEDPAATAAYGRNGRPRFGFYQNGDVDDPELLLQLTWQALQTVNTPDVTIEGPVRDITRFGEVDVPIRLHDSALIEITPTGTRLAREVVQYTEDLLRNENSRVTIGKYIPNIVYITKEVASGGGGGGSGGDSYTEYKLKEFETDIAWNDYQIGLKAWQRDLDKTDENLLLAYAAIGISSSQIQSIVTGCGVQLDPNTGNIVTDANGLPVFATGSSQMWSNIQQQAGQIALVVTGTGQNAAVNTASIVAAVNAAGSSVTINADKITLNGQTLVQEISGIEADFTNLTAGTTTATALKAALIEATTTLNVSSTAFKSTPISIGSIVSYTGLTSSNASIDLDHSHAITMTESSGVVTATLGAAVTTSSGDRTANFNIAATQFYIDAVAAAQATGQNSVTITKGSWSSGQITFSKSAGTASNQYVYLAAGSASWGSGADVNKATVNIYDVYGGGSDPTGVSVVVDAAARYSAGEAAGAAGVTLDNPTWAATSTDENTGFGVSASNGASVSQNLYLTRSSGWVSGTRYVYLRTDSTSGTQRARIAVYMPSVSEASWTWDTPAQGYLRATIRIGGSTYSSSHAV